MHHIKQLKVTVPFKAFTYKDFLEENEVNGLHVVLKIQPCIAFLITTVIQLETVRVFRFETRNKNISESKTTLSIVHLYNICKSITIVPFSHVTSIFSYWFKKTSFQYRVNSPTRDADRFA